MIQTELQTSRRIIAATVYKFNSWRYKTFFNPFYLRYFRYFLLLFSMRLRRFPARHDQQYEFSSQSVYMNTHASLFDAF